MSAPKRVFVKTYGCQMNVYDSERMTAALAAHGYVPTGRPDSADLVLLNTCHIREKAAEKVYSELGRLRSLKRQKPGSASPSRAASPRRRAPRILARARVVDLVVGPQAYHRLPAMLARREAGERPVEVDFPAEAKFDRLPPRPRTGRPAAFLTVQEGCDKFCAFCVVPYTRGAEVSRPAGKVEAEAEHLVARGAIEITLLGQNVNAYRDADGVTLAALIRRLARIEGLARIRYTTSHPCDMRDDLIAAHGEVEKLMPFLHLPVQAGSDRVLRAMNRRHRARDYLAVIARVQPRGRTSRYRATSSSASPARPRPIFRQRSTWWLRSATRRPIPLPTRRARHAGGGAAPRCLTRSRPTGCSGCRRCFPASKRRSRRRWSGRSCPCSSSGRGGCPGRWPGDRRI